MHKRNMLIVGLALMTVCAVAVAIWAVGEYKHVQQASLAENSICKLLGDLKSAGLPDSTSYWYSPREQTGGVTCYTAAAAEALKSEKAQRVLGDYEGCRKTLKGWNFPPVKVEDFNTKKVLLTIS